MHKYFDQNPLLGGLRWLMMVLNLGFSWVLFYRRSKSHIFPSFKPKSDILAGDTFSTGLSKPSACYINHPKAPTSGYPKNFTSSLDWFPWMSNTTGHMPSNITISSNSSLLGNFSSLIPGTNVTWPLFEQFSSNDNLENVGDVIALAAITFSFMLASGTSALLSNSDLSRTRRHKVAYFLRWTSFTISYSIMIYGFSQFLILRDWMKKSNLFGQENDEYEISSFGQLMPIVLLILPVLALFEQFAGKSYLKSPFHRLL